MAVPAAALAARVEACRSLECLAAARVVAVSKEAACRAGETMVAARRAVEPMAEAT